MSLTASQAHENTQVVLMVHALAGLLTSAIRAISLECGPESTHVRFMIYEDGPECREHISDIVFEFEAHQTHGIRGLYQITFDVEVDNENR